MEGLDEAYVGMENETTSSFDARRRRFGLLTAWGR